MNTTTASAFFSVLAAMLLTACAGTSGQPVAPSTAAPDSGDAGPGGATLKVAPPTPTAPVNAAKLSDTVGGVTLVVANAAPLYGTRPTLAYRFEVYNAAGTRIYTNTSAVSGGSSGTTSHVVNAALEPNQTYAWQARAEYLGSFVTAWSPRATFVTPDVPVGYVNGSELYDPLTNGTTIGQVHGPVEFVPGVGVKLLSWDSYVSYQLPQTLIEGEYSLIVSNMPQNTGGDKQKVMGMARGYSDIVENDHRMTVEKRGDGAIAWRFATPNDRVETEGEAQRVVYPFQASREYFYQATWRANVFNLLIRDGGVNGGTIYDVAKRWSGAPYAPSPHVIYVGAPVGRSGASAASIENTIYRQIWVSSRPRPAFAR